MELNSGFVIAVLIAGLFLSQRFGGDVEWARRMYQIALGAAFAFAVLTGSGAFILQDLGSDDFSSDDISDAGNRYALASTVNFVAGFLGVLFGLAGLSRQRTVPLGILFGGLLLIAGAGTTGFGVVSLASTASLGASLLLFGACAGGFLVLYAYGVDRYEREHPGGSPDS
jgi:hypothetical protein